MSLSTRFAVQFGLAAALTVALALTAALGLFKVRLDSMAETLGDNLESAVAAQLRREAETLLDTLSADIREDLLAYDRGALDERIADLLRRSNALAVAIYDSYGRTVADSGSPETVFERSAPRPMRDIGKRHGIVRWYDGNRMVSGQAVCLGETCFGAVSVTLDATVIAKERAAAETQIDEARGRFFLESGLLGAGALVIGAAVAALVGWLLGRRLMQGLKSAILGLEQVASGAVDVKIDAKETELKELAAAVEKVAERLAVSGPEQDAILADMADGLFVAGLDGHLIVANPALHGLFSASPGSLVQADGFALFGISPQPDAAAFCAALAGVDTVRRKDGATLPVMVSAKVSEGRDGQPRVVGVMRDIADRVAVERQLLEAQMRAEAADKAKAEFLAVMSHELRTPLNGVLGGAAVLAGSELTDSQRSLVGMVQNSGRALLTMVTNILDFTRTDSAEATVEQAPVDLEAIAREIAAGIGEAAAAKGLDINVRVQPDIPVVLSDEEKLLEIGRKLADNAVKFTEEGAVGIDISYDRQGSTVAFTLSVDDSGIGIDPEKRDTIFELFSQGDSSERRIHGGTGLGLSITKRLTELLGGEITVESEPGVGTTFRVNLQAPVDPAAAPAPKPPVLDGARTMVVAPNAREREALAEQLVAAGAETESFETAAAAVEALRAALADGQPFGLVVHPEDLADFEPSGLADWLRENDGTVDTASVVVRAATPALGALPDLPERVQRAAAPVTGSVLLDASARAMAAAKEEAVEMAARPAAAPQAENTAPEIAVVKELPPAPKVLLAEGNEVNRIVLSAYLKKAGYTVDTAENGFDAVRQFKEDRPALVLMDVDMGVMNGLEATKAIRRHEIEEGIVPIPIIGLAAARRDGERERCNAAGMNDHLPKPIKIEELEAKLERWTKLAQRPVTPPAASAAS